MAHETLVHRADAQLAAGAEPEPAIEAEVAADAIDEWLTLLAGGLGDPSERAGALPGGAACTCTRPMTGLAAAASG